MQKKDKIKLGIIGCGKVSHERHVPALNLIPEIEIVAAADTQEDRVRSFASKYNVPKQSTDYQHLLNDPEIDAVGILTPTSSHVEIGLAALEANKHIFMEKPLALSVQDCDRLISSSKSSDAKVLLCFNLRWHRLIKLAKKEMSLNKLGKIKAIRSVYTHFREGQYAPDWHRILDAGGGVTFNESVHHFDLWNYFLNDRVKEIKALHTSDQFYEDESSVIAAIHENGVLGSAFNTFRTSPNSEVEIYGEKGRLYINMYRFDGLDFFSSSQYPGSIPDRIKKIPQTLKMFTQALPILRRGGDFQATFYNIWSHFADCIRDDNAPECTLEDGKLAIATALAAIEAFKRKEGVHINV
ncbi:hypothetical protein GF406_22980 [candidate division KSB1 bacterium]|nr:hypothetical protein [candidate division KSB1 bacterium]